MDKRYHKVQWGKGKDRQLTSEAYWRQPLKWNKQAKAFPYGCNRCKTRVADPDTLGMPWACECGGTFSVERPRVFCASLADVFDQDVPDLWRMDLFELISACPNLDWLILTKRPYEANIFSFGFLDGWPWKHVWLGVSVENQEQADKRIPILLQIPAKVKFLSCEPLLGPIAFEKVPGFNRIGLDLSNWWVIVGGESGHGARPMHPDWARSIRDQCLAARVPFFMKQMDKKTPIPEDLFIRQFPHTDRMVAK